MILHGISIKPLHGKVLQYIFQQQFIFNYTKETILFIFHFFGFVSIVYIEGIAVTSRLALEVGRRGYILKLGLLSNLEYSTWTERR